MKVSYVNGYGIRYFDYDKVINQSNDRKDLILLHGLGASAERWLRVIPDLTKCFRVIVPDIIGFGYSDKPTVEYTMDFFIKFFKDFLENLNIDKPYIVGSSFGGHLATEFAIRYNNRIEKLVLAAPAGMMRSSTHHLDQYLRSEEHTSELQSRQYLACRLLLETTSCAPTRACLPSSSCAPRSRSLRPGTRLPSPSLVLPALPAPSSSPSRNLTPFSLRHPSRSL